MPRAIELMPQLEGEELQYVQSLIETMSDDMASRFVNIYAVKRRDPTLMLILALVGLLWVAGIHRFMLGQIGMGVLYLLTGGLCYIGTIVDLFNIKKMTMDYNMQAAHDVAAML